MAGFEEYLGGPSAPVAPTAAFTSDVQTGTAPLTVQFTDQSTGEGITDWAWDVNNDGTVDYATQNATHTYTAAGTYTVNLTVTNAGGSDSEVKTDYITVSEAALLPVLNTNSGLRYATIQAAVTAATAGDEIVVGDGTYTENVDVDKQLVIRSENGSASVTVTAASPTLPVFDVNANGVVIRGFTVRGPTDTHVAGIEIVGYNDCRVVGNDCAGCYNGIHIGGTGTNNTIEANYCHGNTQRGISVRDTAHDNYILKNVVESNTDAGFCIKDSTYDNTLWLNDVIGNRVEILTATTAHSPEPLTYTYNGGIYTGYLGNYYADYSGTDADGNGVGTPSYAYGSGGDNYPLMARFASYAETEPAVFLWGPYLTGSLTTETTVNLKTDIAAAATVEYATDAYYTANGGYERSASDGLTDTLHHVALTGLEPGTLYHYRVTSGGATSGDLHFRTFPESGPFTFIAYGDTRDQLPMYEQSQRHKLVADRIAEESDALFVLHTGDLVTTASDPADWDRYFDAGRTMMANLSVFPALGNHEENHTLYYDAYGVRPYYSFDCADAHFSILDSNSWTWPGMAAQSAWLDADLAGTAADWKFVAFHHPPYTSSSSHFGGWTDIRGEWEDEFVAHGVDAVWNAHVHAYERFLVNGIQYVVVATGGAPSYALADPKYEGSQSSLENALGYVKVTVDPAAGTATARMIRVAGIATDGSGTVTVYPSGTVFETFVLSHAESPVAEFSADVLSGTAPLTVQFTDESSNTPTSWAWDVDNDGTIDYTTQNASHVYDTAGTYTVNLTVTNAGGSDSEAKPDYITVESTPAMDELYNGVVVLTEGATFSQVAYNSGYSYTIDETTPLGALHATALTYNVTDKRWSYDEVLLLDDVGPYLRKSPGYWYAYVNDVYRDGYGNHANGLNAIDLADGDTVEFYYAAGISNASEIATVKAAATAAVLTTVDIQTAPTGPTAQFTANVTGGTVPLTVQFTDQSTGGPTSWAWDFENDGTVDTTEQSPSHTYGTAGIYTVKLAVTNTAGSDSEVKTGYITVTAAPTTNALRIQPVSSSVIVGETRTVDLVLDQAPEGVAGFNITVALADGAKAEITAVSFPSWATLHSEGTLPADTVWVKSLDPNRQIEAGATAIVLATITLRGDQLGSTAIQATVIAMDDDDGTRMDPDPVPGTLTVSRQVPVLPGHPVPTDPNDDGLYEDLNGNGRADFNDVVLFFNHMEWIATQAGFGYFDFNGNGRIDFDDVVKLFWGV